MFTFSFNKQRRNQTNNKNWTKLQSRRRCWPTAKLLFRWWYRSASRSASLLLGRQAGSCNCWLWTVNSDPIAIPSTNCYRQSRLILGFPGLIIINQERKWERSRQAGRQAVAWPRHVLETETIEEITEHDLFHWYLTEILGGLLIINAATWLDIVVVVFSVRSLARSFILCNQISKKSCLFKPAFTYSLEKDETEGSSLEDR